MLLVTRRFVDETYVKVASQRAHLYQAADQHGLVVDVLLSVGRDLTAARRLVTRALRAGTVRPRPPPAAHPSARESSVS